MLGGALLVGLHLLAEYGALQLLNYPTLTTAILQQYAHGLQRAGGQRCSPLVLVLFCLLLLGIELLLRGHRRCARVGSGAARAAGPDPAGPAAGCRSSRSLGASRVLGAGRPARARWCAGCVRGTSTPVDRRRAGGATAHHARARARRRR